MTTTITRAALAADLVRWLDRRFGKPGVCFEADTLLFEHRRIDSIRILELIAWTERAIGRRIADADIRMDNFQSASRIAEVFAPEDDDAHR